MKIKSKLIYLITPNAKVSARQFLVLTLIEVVLLLLLWQYNESPHFPGPKKVFEGIIFLFKEANFLQHLLTSFFLAIGAMTLSVFLALGTSYFSILPIGKPIAWMTTKFRFSAFNGFVFIFSLMFPSGFMFKLYSLAFILVPWIVTNKLAVINDVEKMRYTHLRTLGFPEWKVAREVIIYGKFAKALQIVQQNFALVWTMIATVEGVYIGEGGIGSLLELKRKFLANLHLLIGIQFTVLILAVLVDYVLTWINKNATPYEYMSNENK